MPIPGVGSEYSDLLEAAGVDFPPSLLSARREPRADVHGARRRAPNTVRRVPSEATVEDWIKEAKRLEGSVSH